MSETRELRERPPAEREAYLAGARAAFEAAARALELSADEIRLHAGEIAPQAMRDVKAVLAWRARTLRAMAEALPYAPSAWPLP